MLALTLPGLIVLIVIAAICGAVGKAIAGGGKGGLIASIALGFIGALAATWGAHQLHLSEPLVLQVSGQPFPIVWSIVGAALFVALLHVVFARRWARQLTTSVVPERRSVQPRGLRRVMARMHMVVARNRDLSQVVQEAVQQNLRRLRRHERREHEGPPPS